MAIQRIEIAEKDDGNVKAHVDVDIPGGGNLDDGKVAGVYYKNATDSPARFTIDLVQRPGNPIATVLPAHTEFTTEIPQAQRPGWNLVAQYMFEWPI